MFRRNVVWCLILIIAVMGIGGPITHSPAAAQDELTCPERMEQAGRLAVERANALAAGNVVLALSLMRQTDDLLAPCVGPDSVTGLFAARKAFDWDEVYWAPVIEEFDGVPMAQVPGGCFMMGSNDGDSDEAPITEVCFYTPYWIDQTEVTRAQYAACVTAGACSPAIDSAASTQDNQPINRVTWFQATNYCSWRGMQLPTEAEWEYAVRGPAGWKFSWGDEFDPNLLAYALNSNGMTTPVGSYPDGKSWTGALDMTGNVAEWVRTVYHPYPYDPVYNRGLGDTDSPRGVRGGSYSLSLSNYLTTTRRQSREPSFELDTIGFRCVNAPTTRPEHISQAASCDMRLQQANDMLPIEEAALTSGNISLAQLALATARDVLAPCAENTTWIPRIEMFSNVEMAFVPSGCFQMGRADGTEAEQPVSDVCMDNGYWIDKTEVTRAQYASCVEAGVCTEAPETEYATRETQPINNVTWFQARTYCGWRGARLPTEAEWEYAARGPENRLYPWGDSFAALNLVYAEEFEMADVGSIPAGASWVGALDMSGNAREWVSSLFLDYPYDPAQAEQPADTTAQRVLRGGSFYNFDQASVSATYRDRADPDFELYTNGFRCARDG